VHLRSTVLLFAACLLAPSTAFAGYYSNTRCDGPIFEPHILASLGTGISERTNRPMADHLKYGPIVQSTLISNTGDALTCEVTVQYGVRQIHGRFTATMTPKGAKWQWLPAY
jgi:hypothetical protein